MTDSNAKASKPDTTAPEATSPKRARKLRAVQPPSAADSAASEQKARWALLEREARAKREGVPVDKLELLPDEIEENWRSFLPVAREAASPDYAGLYKLTGGRLNMPGHDVAPVGSYVRLGADDGRTVTESGIGVWVKP